MKTVTRYGLFETNSSSVHSITIRKHEKTIDWSKYVDKDGKLTFYLRYYGREDEEYDSPVDKMAYLLTLTLNHYGYDGSYNLKCISDMITDIINHRGYECPDGIFSYDFIEMAEFLRNSNDGSIKSVELDIAKDISYFGIDHQSETDIWGFLHNMTIEDFVGNNDVVLKISGD